jgi:uncharacterized protein YkwD
MRSYNNSSVSSNPTTGIRLTLASIISLTALLLMAGVVAANGKEGSRTSGITNPDANTACSITFSDVTAADYYYEPVRYLYCMGAVGGYPDGTFRPGSNTTRGQLSKIVVIAKEWPLVAPQSPSFPDVQPGNSFYSYVETALAHGILGGYSDGTFRPNSNITRGQLAKVVVLAEKWSLLNPATPSFNDVSKGNSFYPYVETAVSHSVISGYSDNTFRPGYSATRGQITKIVYYAVTGQVPPPPPTSTPLPPPTNTPTVSQVTQLEQQTVDIINGRRAALGLGLLTVNPSLSSAARRHSSDIGPQGLCQHNGTDGSSPWDRAAQAGYTGFAMGEVVGCNYPSPSSVVDAWWASPGHHAILIDPAANDIGCGWWLKPDGYGWQTCVTGSSTR